MAVRIFGFQKNRFFLEVEAGSRFSGEFRVYAVNGIDVRAKVFSSNKQMHCAETDIIGTESSATDWYG